MVNSQEAQVILRYLACLREHLKEQLTNCDLDRVKDVRAKIRLIDELTALGDTTKK